MQYSIERGRWEFDVGMAFSFRRWGLGFTADWLGSSAPNGVVLSLGPISFWLTIWHWAVETGASAYSWTSTEVR
jgi:hypothetical protein